MAELEDAFGVPVVEAYGMTEACHQITSNPLPPRVRKPGSVGLAVGTEVRVIDGTGAVASVGETGEVVIRGPALVERDRARDQQWLDGDWLRTGDIGYRDTEGYLFISGRLKELVNRGGSKVAPAEVEEAMLAHPAVAEAAAFGVPHPTLGEDLVGAVVLRNPDSDDVDQIVGFLRERLTGYKVPSLVLAVDRFPLGPTGKLQRLDLARALAPRLRAAPTAPRTALEVQVAKIWAEILDLAEVGVHDDFIVSGGDSLSATRCLARVFDTFLVEVSLDTFMRAPTVAALAELVTTTLAEESAEIERTLAEVEDLSDDMVRNLIRSDDQKNG
jgi:hypothetical protein